jgi:hypothetical protein
LKFCKPERFEELAIKFLGVFFSEIIYRVFPLAIVTGQRLCTRYLCRCCLDLKSIVVKSIVSRIVRPLLYKWRKYTAAACFSATVIVYVITSPTATLRLDFKHTKVSWIIYFTQYLIQLLFSAELDVT